MRPLLLALAMILPATQAAAERIQQIEAPSGITVDHVKCSRNPNRCMNAAAEFCAGSYQVIDSESHMGTIVSDVFVGQVTWYTITFLCGKSDGVLPDFPYGGPNATPPKLAIPPQISTICTVLGKTRNCRSQ